MSGQQPLYFMIKPPEHKALEFDRQRKRLGLDDSYGWRRIHSTVLPLGDGHHVSDARLELLDRTVLELNPASFLIEFNQLRGNVLIAAKGAREVRAFRQRASRILATRGLQLPTYESAPHLSLAYGPRSNRVARVRASGWKVERLLLIRSIHGEGRHELIHEWPMIAHQYEFGF